MEKYIISSVPNYWHDNKKCEEYRNKYKNFKCYLEKWIKDLVKEENKFLTKNHILQIKTYWQREIFDKFIIKSCWRNS